MIRMVLCLGSKAITSYFAVNGFLWQFSYIVIAFCSVVTASFGQWSFASGSPPISCNISCSVMFFASSSVLPLAILVIAEPDEANAGQPRY